MKSKVKFKIKDMATANISFKPEAKDSLELSGRWIFKCYDRYDSLKWTENVKNIVVNEGLNHLLNVQFHNETQVHPWYMGLKETSGASASDTLSSHAGWTEFTDYSGDRQEYVEGESTSESMASSAASVFAITGSGWVFGAFLCSVATGSDGVLFSAVDFESRKVANGDQINCSYTITSADS